LHGYEERLTSDIYPADYGWAVNWDEPDVRPSWYHNMSSVLQAGPCVRTNQLDFDEEVVFKAQQYLFDHIREDGDQPFCLTVSMTHPRPVHHSQGVLGSVRRQRYPVADDAGSTRPRPAFATPAQGLRPVGQAAACG
jgi:arylsulfatase A-like enzyme